MRPIITLQTQRLPLIALHADNSAVGKQWVHLLPAGSIYGHDGRGPFTMKDLDAIAAETQRLAGQTLIPIDYNHGTDLLATKGQEAPAAGWIVGLEARRDGLWGHVEWTPKATKHIADKEYRYLSPVIAHDKAGNVSALMRASLVNNPNFKMLTALASAQEDAMDGTVLLPAELVKKLKAALSLPEDADEKVFLDGLGTFMDTVEQKLSANAQEPDPGKYVPIGMFKQAVAETNKLRQGISLQAATDHVESHIKKGHILPFMREWAVSLCQISKPSFDDFIAGVGPGFSHLLETSHAALPVHRHGQAADTIDDEIALNMGLDAGAFSTFRSSEGR